MSKNQPNIKQKIQRLFVHEQVFGVFEREIKYIFRKIKPEMRFQELKKTVAKDGIHIEPAKLKGVGSKDWCDGYNKAVADFGKNMRKVLKSRGFNDVL